MLHGGETPPPAARLWRAEGCQSLSSRRAEAFSLRLVSVGDSVLAQGSLSDLPSPAAQLAASRGQRRLAGSERISCEGGCLARAKGWLVARLG